MLIVLAMRFLNLTCFIIFLFSACQNMGSAPSQQAVVAVRDIEQDSQINDEQSDSVSTTVQKKTRKTTFVEDKIILPGAYRIWEEADDLARNMKGEWLELVLDQSKLVIEPITLIFENGFDACAGIKTTALKCQHNSLMSTQVSMLKQGVYKATTLINDRVWPNDKVDFTFNGQPYQLQGFGDISETEIVHAEDGREMLFHAVSHYELQLIDPQGDRITLVSEESFNDTFIQIKFVGDLDGDNKPDFIIAAPRDYEEERISLILSTDTDPETIRIHEATRQFDC